MALIAIPKGQVAKMVEGGFALSSLDPLGKSLLYLESNTQPQTNKLQCELKEAITEKKNKSLLSSIRHQLLTVADSTSSVLCT